VALVYNCKSAIRSRVATWRVMFEKIIYRPIDYCLASRQVARVCPHPGIAIADTVAKDDIRR